MINRLGFNNEGHEAAERRLAARKGRAGIVGVNIGANKDSADRIGDYELRRGPLCAYASYLTVNISSPNTPGLRNMQAREQLGELLSRVIAARAAASAQAARLPQDRAGPCRGRTGGHRRRSHREADSTASSSPTPPLHGRRCAAPASAGEAGGLSGKPLFERSTIVLAKMRKLLGPDRAIIGVGGVDSAETALEKIRAGADLVQLYTGMIYAGPALPGRILAGMVRFRRQGTAQVDPGVARHQPRQWASKPL